jgi:hypothetical protein
MNATCIVECTDKVADILGVSSILIQDFKERRQNTYKFSWDKVLSFEGDSGVYDHFCIIIVSCYMCYINFYILQDKFHTYTV